MWFHGSILNENSQGTNELIKEGAIPITDVDDIINNINGGFNGSN